MTTGAPFQAGQPISASELNQKTITYSDNIAGTSWLPGQFIVATTNNGAWLKNDVTMRKVEDDGFAAVSQSRHLHNADNNQSGGLLSDIYRANVGLLHLFHKPLGFGPSDIYTYGSATATIILDLPTGATKLDTIGTASNYLVSKLMGTSPSLKVPITLKTKMQFHGNITNVFVRWGMNMEPMDLSNSNTVKFGIESCPAVNGNWNLVSSDGTTRTAIDAGASLEGTTTVSSSSNSRDHTIDFLPGSMINYYYHNNSVISKSTQLPPITSVPGTIPADNVVNYGLKTADTNAKQLYIWGLAVLGGIDDPGWKAR
jgi:hypothetical protein